MSILAQGTQMYGVIDGAVVEIECITAFNAGTNPASNIQDTCLSETKAHTYKKGLRTPSQATVTINADPKNDSHYLMWQLAEERDDTIQWAIGWRQEDANGNPVESGDPPTLTDGELVLPESRTWYTFRASVTDFPFDFQTDAVVATSATLQRSGAGVWVRATESGS